MWGQEVMASAAAEERSRRTLAVLVEQYRLLRGNWEVDYPEMVERVLAMASGRAPLCGRFAAVAGDSTYTFIEVAATEAHALELLAIWAIDECYPKCPLALVDLQRGCTHKLRVEVTSIPGRVEQVSGC